jgi:SAM-dependent methyltransferase
MMDKPNIEQHNIEIRKNLESWEKKPVLREIYKSFYRNIHTYIRKHPGAHIVELGSGIGNIKTVIPEAICTDIFRNPWIDQVENAYSLSFEDNSVSDLILFDVFHHFEYPGYALAEFYRVLVPGGRVIIFDPSVSALGMLVYGAFHHEPVAWMKKIKWLPDESIDPWKMDYYAAQGNAQRVFFGKAFRNHLGDWNVVEKKKYSALSYVLSGGYSKPQLFPSSRLETIRKAESLLDKIPSLFSTRLLVVLEKK